MNTSIFVQFVTSCENFGESMGLGWGCGLGPVLEIHSFKSLFHDADVVISDIVLVIKLQTNLGRGLIILGVIHL